MEMATTNECSSLTSYVYLNVADALKAVGQKVNLFGLVASVGTAGPTTATDYAITLRVIDPSCPSPGISVNFTSESEDKLPQVRSVGDLICLHQIMIEVHGDDSDGVYNTKISSYALYDVKDMAGFNYYQADTKNNAINDDKEFILRLRKWFSDLPLETDLDEEALTIQRIKNNLSCNLVCKVLHVYETSERKCILFVWDGTDSPTQTFSKPLDLEGPVIAPVDFGGLFLSQEVLSGFPGFGSVLRVFTGKSFEEFSISEHNGRWVKLSNITCEVEYDGWKVMLHHLSKINILSDEDWVVRRRMKVYNDRSASRLECRPIASFPEPSDITAVLCGTSVYGSLRESLVNTEAIDHHKCIVRVVSMVPCLVEDLCAPDGLYRLRFTLEDPTARINAYLCEKEYAETFFNGDKSYDSLSKKLDMMLGITDVHGQVREDGKRDPPWIWCHFRSIQLGKDDYRGVRLFQICLTRLVGK